MRRCTPALMAAMTLGLSVSATRQLEDREDARLPDADPKLSAPTKVHKHTREIERRLRQQARREAKTRGVA